MKNRKKEKPRINTNRYTYSELCVHVLILMKFVSVFAFYYMLFCVAGHTGFYEEADK